MLSITYNTTIVMSQQLPEPVGRAVHALQRDIRKACLPSEQSGAKIRLVWEEREPESYRLAASHELELYASDALGFVYGIYEISRSLLGITNFWFWNDQKIIPQKEIPIPSQYSICSEPFRVRYRGWFVNDEVLLHTWSVDRSKDKPWEMVFEALLRCGGNLVVPGTDRNSVRYRDLACAMGLYLTHHHAEPLGAEMFARAYPDLVPSYAEHPEEFQRLWRDGIQAQKEKKVLWNLGFRGQGDCPFWENDPRYQTEEKRGALMSELIRLQYNMLKQELPEAVCCTNLYGETMELYQKGFLELPKDVIRIWADNGYGKMVSRRQNNHNPRLRSLPDRKDRNGIYYHVSFYDLQAANHITMLPNSPEFVCKELEEALEYGAQDLWLVNCSNVKPHVYFLDLLSRMWKEGKADVPIHRKEYTATYYGPENADIAASCLEAYPRFALSYGKREDEHAGEQFANHPVRILVSQFMKDRSRCAQALLWAMEGDTLEVQISQYQLLCEAARQNYKEYLKECSRACEAMSESGQILFRDSILLQAELYSQCFSGATLVCESLKKAQVGDYQRAFYLAGKARKRYLQADQALRCREHGKWNGFYANECLTDVKQTAWVLEGLMSYLRNFGDGPHFYQWQRDFLYPEEDRRVLLILNMENHLRDEELFALMEEKWEDETV